MGDSDEIEEFEPPRDPPASSPEAQENRMISLAVTLAEKQLEEGTASVPVITHYLKLATIRETKEREQLSLKNELLKAQTIQIGSAAQAEKVAKEAIEAFRSYVSNDFEMPDEE